MTQESTLPPLPDPDYSDLDEAATRRLLSGGMTRRPPLESLLTHLQTSRGRKWLLDILTRESLFAKSAGLTTCDQPGPSEL